MVPVREGQPKSVRRVQGSVDLCPAAFPADVSFRESSPTTATIRSVVPPRACQPAGDIDSMPPPSVRAVADNWPADTPPRTAVEESALKRRPVCRHPAPVRTVPEQTDCWPDQDGQSYLESLSFPPSPVSPADAPLCARLNVRLNVRLNPVSGEVQEDAAPFSSAMSLVPDERQETGTDGEEVPDAAPASRQGDCRASVQVDEARALSSRDEDLDEARQEERMALVPE